MPFLKDDSAFTLRRNAAAPDAERAQAIAADALAYLASDPDLFERFLRVTGLEVHSLRAAAETPGFFAGVLDFILAHEPTLTAFADHAELSPEAVAAARRALDASDSGSETPA